MNFFKILDKLKKKKPSLILYCILNRIPIFVFGNNEDKIDEFIVEFSELIHFRKEFVFYTDFLSLEEHNHLIQNEYIDYNSQRAHIRCPCDVAFKALKQFNNFNSWIIGIVIPNQKEEFLHIKNQIKEKIQEFLCINISSKNIIVELEGLNVKVIDFTLEQNILQKVFQDTERSITRMKRALSQTINSNKISKELIKMLLDFEAEKKELKRNIFKKEIQNFYSGSKRAYYIFSKLNILSNLEVKAKIGNKILLDTIDYIDAPIERILSFINKEWGENFYDFVEYDKKVIIGEKISTLWGLEKYEV